MTSVRLPQTPAAVGRVSTDPFDQATLFIVHAAVLAVGVDLKLPGGIPLTLVLGLGLLPLWVRSSRRFSFAPAFGVLVVASAVSGLVLSELTSVTHSVDGANRVSSIALLLSGGAAVGILLWARTLVPMWRIVVLYGLGALGIAVVSGELSWKYNLSVPTTLVVLGVLERRDRRLAAALAALGLGVLGIVDEGRSFFGFCLMAATLTLWQLRPAGREDGPVRRWRPVALVGGLGAGLYLLASSLLTGGYLGTTLQERSTAQVEATGSLISGARPEWAATRELIRARPSGYGAGVVPSWQDLEAGRSGLASIRIDAGGYTNNYMFGGQFRLHSVAADLWVSFGWVGVALAATILAAILSSLGTRLVQRRAPTSVLLLSGLALWYLAFGPIYSNWIDVCVALALVLVLRDPDDGAELHPT